MRITDEMKSVFVDATSDAMIANKPNPTYFGLEAVLAMIPDSVLDANRLLEACRNNPRAEDEERIASLEAQIERVRWLCKHVDVGGGRGSGTISTFRILSALDDE